MKKSGKELNRKTTSIVTAFLLILVFNLLISTQTIVFTQEEIPREKTVICDIDGGIQPAPEIQNPYLIGHTGMGGGAWIVAIEMLYYINYLNGTIDWWLAKGLEYGPEYKNMTLYLREGITWSDGEDFTAEDVVFTYKMLKEHGPAVGWGVIVNETVKDVKALDDYTVHFEFYEVDPRFHLRVTGSWGWAPPIVPKHIWADKDPETFDNYPPVWTGPYELVEATQDRFVWKRRDDYWAAEVLGSKWMPKPEYVMYIAPGPPEKRILEMTEHRMDALCDIGKSEFLSMKDKNSYVRAWYPSDPYAIVDPCPRYLMLNNRMYPWNISDVRRAVSLAIDRSRIVDVAYENTSFPKDILIPKYSYFELMYFNHIQDLIDEYKPAEYNPTKAAEILEELGFSKGDDGVWRTPNGTRLELTILIPVPYIEIQRNGLFAAEDLRAFGIDATTKSLDGAPFGDAWGYNRFDAMSVWMCRGGDGPYLFFENYHSKYYGEMGEHTAANHEGYINPELDALVDELEVTPDGTPRAIELYRKITEILLRDAPSIPLTDAVKMLSVDTYYWENWPSSENPYCWMGTWWPVFKFAIHKIQPTGKLPPQEGTPIWVYGSVAAITIAVIVALVVYRRRRAI